MRTPVLSAVFIIAACTILFKFMRNAKARDFYISLPHSLGSVLFRFSAAVFTWAELGILCGALLRLPFELHADTDFAEHWLMSLLIQTLLALFMCAAITLAASLTGRLKHFYIMSAVLCLMPDMLNVAASALRDNYFRRFSFFSENTPNSLSPIALFISDTNSLYDYLRISDTSITDPMVLTFYGVFAAIYIAAAALFVKNRSGNAACKAFVGRGAYIFSLNAAVVTLLCAVLYLVMQVISTDILPMGIIYTDNIPFISLITVAAVAVTAALLPCSFKNKYKALRTLYISATVAIGVFCIGGVIAGTNFYCTPNASDIKSISIEKSRNNSILVQESNYSGNALTVYRLYSFYGAAVTEDHEFKNQHLNEIVAEQLSEISDSLNKKEYVNSYDGINLRINLKDGSSIIRSLSLDDDSGEDLKNALFNAIRTDNEYKKSFFSLPDANSINISIKNTDGINENDALIIYETFRSEFEALAYSEKIDFIKNNVYVSENGYTYFNSYYDTAVEGQSFNGITRSNSLSITVQGYAGGHKYDQNFYFEQIYGFLDKKQFPKTYAARLEATKPKDTSKSEYADFDETAKPAKIYL